MFRLLEHLANLLRDLGRLWTTLRGEHGDGETAVAIAVGAGNVAVAFEQRVDEGTTSDVPLLTFDAAAPVGGGSSDGYVAVFPAP